MVIIPLTGKISWKNPPYLTIGLVLINVLVFTLFQLKDNSKHYEAAVFYFESGLADMEVRAYADYLNNQPSYHGKKIDIDGLEDKARDEALYKYYREIMADAAFLKQLRAGQIITADMPHFNEWETLRTEFDEKMSAIVSYRFGFKPGFPDAASLFTHMFLHGGWEHLLGNMVFLWLAGCLVETALKRPYYLPAYIFTGLAAVSLYWVFNKNSGIQLVGASGAISGLMGLLATLYGTNKIKVFYSLGFYFNYLKAPAILLLPLWVGAELFQVLWGGPSNVAYLAHVGGFVGGGAAGLLLTRLLHADKPEAITEAPEDRVPHYIEQALKEAGELNIKEALAILDRALEEYPGHLEIMQQQYKIARMDPENGPIHAVAGRLLTAYCASEGGYARARELYDDYVRAVNKPKLPLQVYARLTGVYISLGDMDRAEKFVALFLKRKSDMPELPVILLRLARAFKATGNSEKYEKCRRILLNKYPGSREAGLITQAAQA